MARDIFISYSSRDAAIANEICQALESSKFNCWIAPRNVLPGTDWSEAIVQAITDAKVVVVIFSSSSNISEPVKNEVVTAADLRKQILPFRIENVTPTAALRFHLVSRHWLDAYDLPLEAHIERLVNSLNDILNIDIEIKGESPSDSGLESLETTQIETPREISLFPLPTPPRRSLLFHSLSYLRSSPNIRRLALPLEGTAGQTKLKRIWSCRNPFLLWSILKKAIRNDVDPGGISPLSCFKRWAADKNVLFRVLEEVNLSDFRRRGQRVRPAGFKGFYSIYPLTEHAQELLESGALHYDFIDSSHMSGRYSDYTPDLKQAIWLFILDFEIIMPSVAAPYLVFDLIEHLRQWLRYNPNVKGVSTLAATPKGEEFARTFGFRTFTTYLNASGHGWKMFYLERSELGRIMSKISPQFLAMLSMVKHDYTLDPTSENSVSRSILQLRRITAPTGPRTLNSR